MIRQIEEKVVNRLRQVTSAIRQDGANQVSIITSTAERTAAVEFAKAAAMRPQIVGAALNRISRGSRDRSGALRGAREPEARRRRGAHHARARGRELLTQLLAAGRRERPKRCRSQESGVELARARFLHPGRQRQGIVLSPIVR